MRKFKYYLLLLVVAVISFKFIEQRIFINQLNKDSEKLKECIESYSWSFFGLYPQKKADIKKMLKWTSEVSQPIEIEALNYGFNVYYDEELKKILIYSFGKDRMDGGLSYTPFNSKRLDSTNQFKITPINVFNYIFSSFKSNDIILTTLNIPKLDCDYLLNNFSRRPHFEMLMKDKSQMDVEEYLEEFRNSIRNFELEFKLIQNSNIALNSNFLFMFRNDDLELMCSNISLSDGELKELKVGLIKFFEDNKLNYFDYALFPITLNPMAQISNTQR